jgi:hypothetical protein
MTAPQVRHAVVALLALAILGACQAATRGPAGVAAAPPFEVVPMPNAPDSLKFAVLGDFGTGGTAQYEMANQMVETHNAFPFEQVLLVGDNIYGSERPQDFVRKFEQPYRALLDRGVSFHASLGNHDSRDQRYYELFNMDGELYYSFNPADGVRFFALESTYMEPEQVEWLEQELSGSDDAWKIAYFHHPLYSSGARHGSDRRLREILEPLFIEHNVSVVFAGHDHFYERTLLQRGGIQHFVIGSGGQLREGNILLTGLTARGFDTDLAFLVAEIVDDELTFQAISRTGAVVDSGVITRRQTPEEAEEDPWPYPAAS